jgi:DNA adenine methylase
MPKTKEALVQLDLSFSEALSSFAKLNIHNLQDPSEETTDKATPFVKWVGGKRSIMPELVARLPKNFNNYFEPFVGGGALFFEIASSHQNQHNYFLSDINLDLVLTYQVIKKNAESLIEILKKHSAKHSEDYYYKVRSQHNRNNPAEIAARFLYLNKTCYNGLWRVNKKGEFNVPIGRYKNPNIMQESNLWACHDLLQNTKIEFREFDTLVPKKGDLVYFDPPYHPTGDASFTTYTKLDFTEIDQVRLRDYCNYLDKKGVHFMLSNSDAKFIKDLYKGFNVQLVSAPRFVNCKPNQRNSVNEVLITNY